MIDSPDSPFPDSLSLKGHRSQDTLLQDTSDSIRVTGIQDTSDSIRDTGDRLQDTGLSLLQDEDDIFAPPYPNPAQTLIGKVHTLKVERASIGERNTALFDTLRFWAYRQPRPKAFEIWLWLVMEQALELREHLPSLRDFPEREARDTARSVARWCWEHPATAGSSDSERQRKRAYLRAKRARQKAHNRDNEIVVWRDAHGKSWRDIAALMGLSQAGVRKAYTRKKAEKGG